MFSKTTTSVPFAAAPQPSQVIEMIDVWFMRARTRKALAKMTAEQRDDCALSYAEIVAECAKPFWRA